MRRPTRTLLAALLLTSSMFAAPPMTPAAHAQIPVIDPANLAQSLIQVTHMIEQVNNQIQQIQQQAQMLKSLDLQLSPELSRSIGAARQLLDQAEGLRQNAHTIAADMRELYPDTLNQFDLDGLLTQSDRWLAESRDSMEGLMTAAAAGSEGLGDADAAMQRALSASASAEGQTSATQASTQAIGVLSVQLARLQALQSAQARALAAERLERIANEERAREVRRQAFPTHITSDAPPAQPRF